MQLIYLLSFLFLSILPADDLAEEHAIYVSVVEISYGSDRNGKMQVKLFTDDLEDAILNHTGTRVKLNGNCARHLELMEAYLKEHLAITIDRQAIDYNISGCEKVDISTWLEFSFSCNDDWSAVRIQGDQLMELFPTQSNVFSVKYRDQKRMFRLTTSKRTTEVIFD